MTAAEPSPAAYPPTRPCGRCHVEINAASSYCTFCGTVQRAPGRVRRWFAAIAMLIALGGLAVAGGILLGGATSAPRPFTDYQGDQILTPVPRGWTGGPVAAAGRGARVVFADPSNAALRLTVTVSRPSGGSAVHRARRARALARSQGGFRQQFFGRVFLPGSRPAWRLTYTGGGYAHVLYVFSACSTPPVGVALALRARNPADLEPLVLHVPEAVAVRC